MSARWTSALTAGALGLAVALASPAAAQEKAEKAEAKGERQEKVKVSLAAVNESGITGTAAIVRTEDEEGTPAHKVTLALEGAAAGTYPAHIHGGTCEEGGGVVLALESVRVEAEGSATSSTTISAEQLAAAVGEREVTAAEGAEAYERAAMRVEAEAAEGEMREKKAHGPLFIQVHLPDGTPAACGDVPQKKRGEKGEKPEG